MRHCNVGNCTGYALVNDRCIEHHHAYKGIPCPPALPLQQGSWVQRYLDGQHAKREAIARVSSNTEPAFRSAAMDALRRLVRTMPELTADDLWDALEASGAPVPHEPRALGAIMQSAAKLGLIRATDRWVESRRAQNHARPVRVWAAQ